jgi:hypothetical protein
MTTNTLAAALVLSDDDLLARTEALACAERGTCAELIAHLAALELRPSAHAAVGYGSVFAYCTEALHLSEDAACNRIQAARACRSFPVILDLLASGSVTLSAIRVLGPHLTPENHESVLARARHRRRDDILALVAELAPRPDVEASVRKLPVPTCLDVGDSAATPPPPAFPLLEAAMNTGAATDPPPVGSRCGPESLELERAAEAALASSAPVPAPGNAPEPKEPRHRPVVQPLSPSRYRVQFTVGQVSYERLRRMQALLRREIPDGDAGRIFEHALALLAEKVERTKMGTAARPRSSRVVRAVIRPGADKAGSRKSRPRHIPNEVKRAVWWRDRAQCAFVSNAGHRCTERSYLELHHIQPYAMDGPATVDNISLRCRRHNQFEAELEFGPCGSNRAEHSA